jgi:hypothetical protein
MAVVIKVNEQRPFVPVGQFPAEIDGSRRFAESAFQDTDRDRTRLCRRVSHVGAMWLHCLSRF